MRTIQLTHISYCQRCFQNFKLGDIVTYVRNDESIVCQICANQMMDVSIELRVYEKED